MPTLPARGESPAATDRPFLPALGRLHAGAWLYEPAAVLAGAPRLRQAAIKAADLRAGERLLDVGCGTGMLLRRAHALQPSVQMFGVDPDEGMLSLARRRLARAGAPAELLRASAQALPFDDRSFDVCVTTLVLHHLRDEDKHAAIAEIRRVLTPGGRLVIADWGRPAGMVSRVLSAALVITDGWTTTRAHLRGRLAEIVRSAGFAGAAVARRLATPCGTAEVITARAPGGRA